MLINNIKGKFVRQRQRTVCRICGLCFGHPPNDVFIDEDRGGRFDDDI